MAILIALRLSPGALTTITIGDEAIAFTASQAQPLGDPGFILLAVIAVTPELRRAVRAARQLEKDASEELERLNVSAEASCDYRHYDERSVDFAGLARERLSALLAQLDDIH